MWQVQAFLRTQVHRQLPVNTHLVNPHMSPFAQSMYSQVKKTHAVTGFVDRNVVLINLISISLILAFFVLYITQVNSSVASGYQMRELETAIHELTIQNKQLQVAARESQSLDNVADSVQMLGLVDAETPQYVQGSEPSYALAQ